MAEELLPFFQGEAAVLLGFQALAIGMPHNWQHRMGRVAEQRNQLP
ncbi:hypothetical protein ACFTXM_14745 [Streptomyces sp. NPDC056930]